MKLLFTGASGFLGNNILPLLQQSYEVTTCGLSPRDNIQCNLSTGIPDFNRRYEIVLHASGKTYASAETREENEAFYEINFTGTKNLCRALEKAGLPKYMIFISTVAVYGCEEGELITENHPLNGKTPYAESKLMAEAYLTDWCHKNNIILTILRATLLAGVNPAGNLGAMITGIKRGFYMNIAGGNARKSILMAEDIANLIAVAKDKGGTYNVCDSYNPSYAELSGLIARQLGKREPVSIPYWIAKCLAVIGDLTGKRFPIDSLRLLKLTATLTFSNEKACKILGWVPVKVMDNFRVSDK